MLRGLSHDDRRHIEDGSIAATLGDNEQDGQAAGQRHLVTRFAHMRDEVFRRAVTGWENVKDESGEDVPYDWDGLAHLLDTNCGLGKDQAGSLEDELFASIIERCPISVFKVERSSEKKAGSTTGVS